MNLQIIYLSILLEFVFSVRGSFDYLSICLRTSS